MKALFSAAFTFLLLAGTDCTGGTLPIADLEDQMNYSLGYQIGEDLKRQGRIISLEAFSQGLTDVQEGNLPRMSVEEMNSMLLTLKKNIQNDQLAERKKQQQQTKEHYRNEGREFLDQNARKPGVTVLPSGLQYQVLKAGTGRKPGPDDTVRVHYRGTLMDGTEFDSSYRKGQPATFQVNGVIAGWSEALQLMREGASWQIYVPAHLAYGERGPLADRTVTFVIELLEVAPQD